MRSISRTPLPLAVVRLSVVFTLALWLGNKLWFGDVFDNPWKYPAKAASLSATMLMCWCLLLSTRSRLLEDRFGGLDKMYQAHKRLGRWAFFIILIHPLCLAANALPDIGGFLAGLWFGPAPNDYGLGRNVGVVAMLAMAALMIITLRRMLRYHLWKLSHEWLGAVWLLIPAHVWLVDADIAAYPALTVWMWGWMSAAALAFLYIRFLYFRLAPHYPFAVERIIRVGGIHEVTFRPLGKHMDFKPSQFVYLVINKEGISDEPHPYSIACGYNMEGRFKLGIKEVGDHTRSLTHLDKGDRVTVYGPYGRFSDKFLSAERDCVFIGGGIGITPFIGMWHTAVHSEERLDPIEVPLALRSMHPEIIKTWKSPRVSLFYVVRSSIEASFDDDIRREVILSRFHGFKALEERGHHYELYLSKQKGRITMDYVNEQVAGGLAEKYVFLCGPTPMVNALIAQCRTLGVKEERIVVEDFNLV